MTFRCAAIAVCLSALAACTGAPTEVAGTAADATSGASAQSVIQVAPSRPDATGGSATADGAAGAPAPPRVQLTAGDVRLYLEVMQAAAGRVQHPEPQDIAAVRSAAAWSALMDVAPAIHALPPAPLAESVLERSANLNGHTADLQVAGERGLDLARYQRIRDTIEAIALSPPRREHSCVTEACRAAGNAPWAARSGNAPKPAISAHDRLLLAPDLIRIRALAAIVRAPRQVTAGQ